MDKKKKDHKACLNAAINDTHDILGNEDQNQVDVKQNTTIGSSSLDNVASQNQQSQPVFQWPYAPLTAVEQPHLIPKSCLPNQSSLPGISNQWYQPQQQEQSFIIHPVQQSQPSAHFGQPDIPFWPPHQTCFHLPGPNPNVSPCCQPLTPERMAQVTCREPGTSSGGILTSQQQTPSFCYHLGCTYPGFPGPLQSSTWWNQPQYFRPHCNSIFPGQCNAFSSLQSEVPGFSTATASSHPRGFIRPPPKHSVKHKQLWEAQSTENVQLWNVICQLQSELAEHKSRLAKLEANVSIPKPILEEVAAHGTEASLVGQTLKKGRQKQSLAVSKVLPLTGASRSKSRCRKVAITNAQCETKIPHFEKVIISKVDGKTSLQQTIQEKIEQKMFGLDRFESKHDNKLEDSTILSISSQNIKGLEAKNSPASYVGMRTNGNFFWPSSVIPGDTERDMMNITAEGLFGDTSTTRKERKFVTEWSFGNEDDHSAGFELVAAESNKDDVEEEKDNDGNSDSEDTA